MKIYLASRFGNRFMLREVRDRLNRLGHANTSRWIDNDKRPNTKEELREFWVAWSKYDIEDVDRADAIVVYTEGCDTPGDLPRDGMRFEMGYAYAKGKPVIVVGPKLFVFDELEDIIVYDEWIECYAAICAGLPYLAALRQLAPAKRPRPGDKIKI